MEWQSAGSAPRDGRTIRLRQGQGTPWHARWKDGEWEPVEYFFGHHATHWQPYIAPPRSEKI